MLFQAQGTRGSIPLPSTYYKENKMENVVLNAWNDLSYVEGGLFTLWLFILYYGKCWIDRHFNK